MGGLSVSDLVQVTINFTPTGAQGRSFGTLLIGGDSNVINGTERYRPYVNIDAVATDFGTTAPEYLAAALYFEQNPQPQSPLLIGRWFSSAAAAQNIGGILNASQQSLSLWTPITNGGFDITIDGTPYTVTGLNFVGQTNLNGVATVITAGLVTAGSTAVCTWNGSEFVITSGTTGLAVAATGTVTFSGQPVTGTQAHGTITLTGNPAANDDFILNGVTFTFVDSGPTSTNILIGSADTDTAANIQTTLAAYSGFTGIFTFSTLSLVTTITAVTYNATIGNAYTLTKTGTNISVSGSGTLASGVNPDSIHLNSVLIYFAVSGAVFAGANLVTVGSSAANTAANLQFWLNVNAPGNSSLNVASYSTTSTVLTITYNTAGTAGNSYSLTKSSSNITLSGADLSGGTVASSVGYATSPSVSYIDISAQLMLTASTSLALIPGFNSETPVQFAAVLANLSPAWYGLMFSATASITSDQSLAVSSFIEAEQTTRVHGVTTSDANTLSSLSTTDLAYKMKQAAYNQSFIQYSNTKHAIASFFGRAFSVDFAQGNSTITLMFKQEPGVTAETLTEDQAAALKAKNCNVFVSYVNNTTILQFGTMSSGQFFDAIQGVDWLQNSIQTALYNVLYTSGKVPQTDAGVNQLTNAIAAVCGQGVNNGLIAPGIWNGTPFGNLTTGQYLKLGYYIYAEPVALQSEADRQTRIAPPIQVAVKLAGAIQSVDVLINVNA